MAISPLPGDFTGDLTGSSLVGLAGEAFEGLGLRGEGLRGLGLAGELLRGLAMTTSEVFLAGLPLGGLLPSSFADFFFAADSPRGLVSAFLSVFHADFAGDSGYLDGTDPMEVDFLTVAPVPK